MSLCHILLLSLSSLIHMSWERIHNIKIESDRREIIPLINFGLTKDGLIEITMSSLEINDYQPATYGNVLNSIRYPCSVKPHWASLSNKNSTEKSTKLETKLHDLNLWRPIDR